MKRKHVLNKCNVHWPDHTGRFPVLYNCNIFQGCSHNCSYCYAHGLSKRWGWVKDWTDAKPIENALELLENDIKSKKSKPGRVMFCSMTDPYQPIEKKLRITRKALKMLLDAKRWANMQNLHSFHVMVVTKNKLVQRDFDIMKKYDNVELGMTVITTDDEKKLKYEPETSSTIMERFETMALAKELGIKTFISLEPWIPWDDHTQPLRIIKMFNPVVDRWIIGRYNYRGGKQKLNEVYKVELPKVIKYLEKNKIDYFLKPDLAEVIGLKQKVRKFK